MKRLLNWLDDESGAALTYTTAIIWLAVIVGGCILAGMRVIE